MDHPPVDVGQAEIAAGIAIGQALVVQAEQVEDGGVQVVIVHLVFDRGEAELIGPAVGDAALDAAAGQPDGIPLGVVVAPVDPFGVWRPPEFGAQKTSVSSSSPRALRSVSRPEMGRSTARAIFSCPLTSFSCWSHR